MYFSNPYGADGNATLKLTAGEYPAVYIPDPQTVVNTTAYYLLRGLVVEALEAPPEYQAALAGFLVREEWASRFGIAKLSGVCRGDWVMHVTADPSKPPGSRLSMHSVHPSAVVPVYDDDNVDQLNKVHLVERVQVGRKELVRRLTYEYLRTVGQSRRVQVSEGLFDPTDRDAWWQEPSPTPATIVQPPTVLPEPIDTIPVYHFPNRPWQAEPFGSSELRGFEGLYATVGQQLTDAGTALSLEGLGVWSVDRELPEGKVYPGIAIVGDIKRVKGIDAISPVVEYVNLLRTAAFEATGTSDIARGMVDVSVAESGVALALRFVPTLAKLELRELKALDRLGQLWYDWARWWKAYEGNVGGDPLTFSITNRLGEKLPFNQTEFLAALGFALTNNLVDREFARGELRRRLGWTIPDDMEARVLASTSAMMGAQDLGGGIEAAGSANSPTGPGQGGVTSGDTGANQ